MKKTTLLALLFAAMPTAIMAQDCPPVSAPYFLDFETATVPELPTCTTQSFVFGPLWGTVNNPGHGFTNVALHKGLSASASQSWFFTQGITLSPGTYRLSYRYGNDSTTTTEKLRSIFVSDLNAPFTNYIGDHDAITGGVPVDFSFESPLTVTETTTYYIGFNAYSEADQGNLYVDNISIEQLVCSAPQAISATNVTATTATLMWLPQTGPITIGYFYGVSTTNTPPADFRMTTNLMADVSDLAPNTTYYAFVSTLCGNETSEWISTSFTTPCDAATVPYNLDFELGVTLPGVPECTTLVTAQNGNNWQTIANPGNGFSDNALQYTGSDTAANAWYFTHGIYLEAGTRYRLSYKYGNNSATTTESLRVVQLSAPNPAGVTDYIITHAEISGGAPVEYSHNGSIAPEVSGIYYFGFNAYSAAGQGNLYLDDIEVNEWICNIPQTVTVDTITTTTATINWQAQTEPTSMGYFFGFNTTDTPPANFTMTPGLTASLENLAPGTTYYAFVQTFCGATFSNWVSVPFTTAAVAGINNTAFAGFKAYPNPVNHILTLDNNTTIDKVAIYNVTGQLVLQQDIKNTNVQINVANLAPGAYLLNIHAGDSRKNARFIKQ